MKTFVITSVAVLTLIGMGAAHADSSEAPTMIVKYGDLDLTRTEGAATLYGRVKQAARRVCANLDVSQSVAPLSMAAPYRACLSNAVSGAVAKIDKPELTALVAAKTTSGTIKLASR